MWRRQRERWGEVIREVLLREWGFLSSPWRLLARGGGSGEADGEVHGEVQHEQEGEEAGQALNEDAVKEANDR